MIGINKIIKVFLLFLLLSTTERQTCFAQQKVQFTQYMFNGLIINPAYAGVDEALSVTFIGRSQWTGIENAPSTQTLSAHTLFRKKQVGLGLTFVNDRIGIHKNINALTSYAYHIRVSEKSYLSMGLQAGIKTFRSDYGSLANAANDPSLNNIVLSKTYFDFAAGIFYRSPRFQLGISAPELIPQQFNINDTLSIQLNRVNFFGFSRYKIPVGQNYALEPSVLIKYLNGVPLSFDINAMMTYRNALSLGLSYRKKESIDFMLRAKVTPQLQFGYAYDHPIGEVKQISNGSHELMINYLFKYIEKKATSPR